MQNNIVQIFQKLQTLIYFLPSKSVFYGYTSIITHFHYKMKWCFIKLHSYIKSSNAYELCNLNQAFSLLLSPIWFKIW